MTQTSLILGTRGSRLALAQTDMVMNALANHMVTCVPRIIKTSGDWKPEDGEKRLSEAEGGKGLFTKEIEQAILDKTVQAGVHSLKDVPSFLPGGLGVDHVLERADPRDVFLTRTGDDLMTLPSGSVVGTSSLRRQSLIKKLRPDLVVVPLRGNVPTRLDKIRQGLVDATILANAGLSRLGVGLDDLHASVMDPVQMLPACGQGIVCIETRLDDAETRSVMGKIHHTKTGYCAMVERTILQILDGSCHTPIGAFAEFKGSLMYARAMVATPDGTESYYAERTGDVTCAAQALELAQDLGEDVRAHAPSGLLPACRTGT